MEYLGAFLAIVWIALILGGAGYIAWRLFKRWYDKYSALAETDPRTSKEILRDIGLQFASGGGMTRKTITPSILNHPDHCEGDK